MPAHKCVGYDALSTDDSDKLSTFIIDQERRLIKCEQASKTGLSVNLNLLERADDKPNGEEDSK